MGLLSSTRNLTVLNLKLFPALVSLLILGVTFQAVFAQQPIQDDTSDIFRLLPLPEVKTDPAVPTLEAVLGVRWGAEITNHQQIEKYIHVLNQAAPDRTRLVEYGTSYEGRKLYYLVLSAPENIARLEAIRADIQRLADPRICDEVMAKDIFAKTPAIVWLGYCVHGNEPSTSDAGLITAWHLLADQSETTKQILKKLVVIIDPLQNPDGRDRFINFFREARGLFSQSYPLANEHTERFPPGRSNHYWIDMNRDWFLQTQRETRAKIAAYLQWHPQIFCDSHEFSYDQNYYFSPPTDPKNPFILPGQLAWMEKLGSHQGGWFDRFGMTYATREMFDAFYPGYGSEWPTLTGGIGILWEQASARGLVMERPDKKLLTYAQGVRQNYVSGLATLEFAAAQPAQLLEGFFENRKRAVELGSEGPVRHFFILNDRPHRAAELARMLQRNGIEVRRVEQVLRVEARKVNDGSVADMQIPIGSYHIPVAQGAGRLLRTLMDKHVAMDEAFLKRQMERNEKKQSDEFYDVTAWSLPLGFDVNCVHCGEANITSSLWDGKSLEYQSDFSDAKVAYAIPESDGGIQLLSALLQEDIRVHVMNQPFRYRDRDFARGTLIVKSGEVNSNAIAKLRQLAKAMDVEVVPIDSGYLQKGSHFGGRDSAWVKPPKVLLVVDEPTDTSSGHTWYLFDHHLKYPTTRIKGSNLSRVRLFDFNVIILPDGSYSGSHGFDKGLADRLRNWVSEGGTLITFKGATEWATSKDYELLKNVAVKQKVELPGNRKEEEKTAEVSPDVVAGAFFGTKVYDDHWVTYGSKPTLDVFYMGNLILRPTGETEGRSLVTFNSQDKLMSSGFCWPKSQALMSETPFLVYRGIGGGHVIGFVNDPNFRASYPALHRLFYNAVMFGPAFGYSY
jgi:hypothetical protein